MLDSKFLAPEKDHRICDSDYCNLYMPFASIFENVLHAKIISETEVAFPNFSNLAPEERDKPTFILQPDNLIMVTKENQWNFSVDATVTKFMLFATLRFDGDSFSAMNYISYFIRKIEIPYVRVGCDYFKVIEKENRFGATNKILKSWKKEEIKEDHTKDFMRLVWKYDDFTILPCNTHYIPVYKNCYNLYAPFPHTPTNETVNENDIPVTIQFLKHIFEDKYEQGLKYFKVLYENPIQFLPVLVLVSEKRETGKTTFLNFLQAVFGENSVQISPQELTHSFNYGYALKNIICIDETLIEKETSAEKLKALATQKNISVSQKHVSQYTVPFFAKFILCTNKVRNFMRIDEEEIRYFIREIKQIEGKKNVNIEKDLFKEIPKFLKFLTQLPEIDYSLSRAVLTPEEIDTPELKEVKYESMSGLRKDLEIYIEDYFSNNNYDVLEVTAKDIKEKWYSHNHQLSISYIRRVIKHEMKKEYGEMKKYDPFNTGGDKTTGKPFLFQKTDFIKNGIGKEEDMPF